MKYVNLTPHSINITTVNGGIMEIPSSGLIRAKQELVSSEIIDDIEFAIYNYSEPIGVPEVLEDDTIYIVSKLALDACREHGIDTTNFVIPGEVIRDEDGRVIGCKSLSRG